MRTGKPKKAKFLEPKKVHAMNPYNEAERDAIEKSRLQREVITPRILKRDAREDDKKKK